jgi:hypothetical protein
MLKSLSKLLTLYGLELVAHHLLCDKSRHDMSLSTILKQTVGRTQIGVGRSLQQGQHLKDRGIHKVR